MLQFPDYEKPFTLYTDVSLSGLGAVLMQPDNRGKLGAIAYASRSLNPTKSNYSITHQWRCNWGAGGGVRPPQNRRAPPVAPPTGDYGQKKKSLAWISSTSFPSGFAGFFSLGNGGRALQGSLSARYTYKHAAAQCSAEG